MTEIFRQFINLAFLNTTGKAKRSCKDNNTFKSEDICRICHGSAEESGQPLIAPCLCAGSIKFVHKECLSNWIKTSNAKKCEVCQQDFGHKMRPIVELPDIFKAFLATLLAMLGVLMPTLIMVFLWALFCLLLWLWIIQNEVVALEQNFGTIFEEEEEEG